MPDRQKTIIEQFRSWAVLGLLSLMVAGGRAVVKDAVTEAVGPLREQVRQLELKVAKLEAAGERRFLER